MHLACGWHRPPACRFRRRAGNNREMYDYLNAQMNCGNLWFTTKFGGTPNLTRETRGATLKTLRTARAFPHPRLPTSARGLRDFVAEQLPVALPQSGVPPARTAPSSMPNAFAAAAWDNAPLPAVRKIFSSANCFPRPSASVLGLPAVRLTLASKVTAHSRSKALSGLGSVGSAI